VFIYFKRFSKGFYNEQSYDHDAVMPDSEITGTEPALMYSDVEAAFERVKPATEN